jgi:TonB family protein
MKPRRLLPPLLLSCLLCCSLPASDTRFTHLGLSGSWSPSPRSEPAVASIENPASLYASRLTPPAPGLAAPTGYRVVVEIAFDETGHAQTCRIHQSDDLTPGAMLNQIALQLAAKVRQEPRLKDGQPVPFTARVPYHFPVEDDEGPRANQAPQPTVVHSQPPLFPDLLARRGENGGAILELTISEKGAVKTAKVLEASHEVCGDAAVAAVKNWTFAPAERNGRPVKSRWRIAVAFEAGREPGELKWRLAPRPSLGFYTVRLNQPGG